MARPRQPVQSLQEALVPRLQPQAAPVEFRQTVAAPPDLPIFDFAAISRTIAGYQRRQQDARDAVAQQKGEQFAEQNRLVMADLQGDLAGVKDPAERDRIQKEAFAMLRKQGEIPDMADPNVRIGLERANGRIMAGQYWQNLQRRLTDVSTVVDPATGLPAQPLDAERVMAEEWEKISQAPAIQGFYGGREALAQKQAADERFLQEVTQRRSAAEKAHYEQTIAQDWGQTFDSILDGNDVVDTQALKPLSAQVAQEVRDHNMLNPREVLLNALELSFRRRAAVDPDDAVRAVHAAQDIVIGGVRLGDDRSGVGERLQELTRQVRQDAKDSAELELRGESTARQLAVQQGQAEFLPALLQAKREGQSIRGVAQRLEQQILADDATNAKYKGRGAFVVNALQDTVTAMERDAQDDPSVTSSISGLIADGRTDAARALAQSAFNSGGLRGETYAGLLDTIGKREDVGRFLEDDNLYNQVKARYNQAAPSGFQDEVQARYDAETLDLQRRLDRDYAEQVRATQGDPNQRQKLRDWLGAREEADNAARTKQTADYRQRRDQIASEIQQRQVRLQDAGDLIDQAEKDGSLTIREADAARVQNIKTGAGKAELLNIAQDESARMLDARIQTALGRAPASQEEITLQVEAQRRLRDSLGLAIDKMLADPANDPRTFTIRARAISDQVVDEIGDKLFPGETSAGQPTPNQNAAVRAGLARGESKAQIMGRVEQVANERGAADGLAARLDPVARETFQASDPIFAPAKEGEPSLNTPGVPKRFYEYAAGWWSKRDPIFGTPVDRETMQRQVRDLAQEVQSSPARDEILAGTLDVIGVDALQVLHGEAQIEAPPEEAEYVRGLIGDLQAGMAVNLFTRPSTQARIAKLQARLEPVKVPLAGHKWKPYITPFFRSRETLSAFSDDPAWPDFLKAVGIDSTNPDEVQAFIDYQTLAIDRSQ